MSRGLSVVALRKFLIRLPLNLRSNRWYVVLGKTLYWISQSKSEEFKTRVRDANLSSQSPSCAVYKRIWPPTSSSHPNNLEMDALLLPNLGRFGNAVRELVSAVAIAGKMNIGNVFLAGDNVFAPNSECPSPGIHMLPQGVTLWISSAPDSSRRFQHLILWSRQDYVFPEATYQAAWDSVFQALSLKRGKTAPDALVIHVRGGDVFGDRDVKNYGQPPLAFYVEVLNRERPKSVILVHQDGLNPVFPKLVEFCEQRSFDLTIQSGVLRDDIATLMSATTLVAGRGTFIPAIVGLSPNIKRVYFFEDKFTVQPPRHGFELFRVFDSDGDYRSSVLDGNWANRPDQRALMLSYPASRLKVEKVA